LCSVDAEHGEDLGSAIRGRTSTSTTPVELDVAALEQQVAQLRPALAAPGPSYLTSTVQGMNWTRAHPPGRTARPDDRVILKVR